MNKFLNSAIINGVRSQNELKKAALNNTKQKEALAALAALNNTKQKEVLAALAALNNRKQNKKKQIQLLQTKKLVRMMMQIILNKNLKTLIIFRDMIIITFGGIEKAIHTFKKLKSEEESKENEYIELIITYLRKPDMYYYIREKSKIYNK